MTASTTDESSEIPALNERVSRQVSEQISKQISNQCDRLRQLTQCNVQTGWRFAQIETEFALIETDSLPTEETWSQWQLVALNAREHVAWERGRKGMLLAQRFVAPEAIAVYPISGLRLLLGLTWWAEAAQVFVNGVLVQEGDLYDHSARVLLSENAQPGQQFDVLIGLISPGHDEGALVRSRCIYEFADQAVNPLPEPGFVADEIAVLQAYCEKFCEKFGEKFAPEKLSELAAIVDSLDWSTVADCAAFNRSLSDMRQRLLPFSEWIKERNIALVGHAHLDLAWLWSVDETWKAAERTFRSVLNLQQEFPELIFGHSTPALYEWVEEHRPDLFAEIQQQIAANRWEVIAGLWVEPELNTVSGEAIARQILYGQQYVQEKFGKISRIAWLPDTFGFCWQLPQLLRQGGVDYFVTQKMRWNDTTEFPYEWFQWRSPDQSNILSLHSAPIGEGIDPIKMVQYACTWEVKTGQRSYLWLPGVGDHGGGPTRDMLEVARRWQQSPFFPQIEFTTVETYLDRLAAQGDVQDHWDSEIYLEFHRGCYTTHADQKLWNRRCEESLVQAETFATIAQLLTAQIRYPKAELEQAWKDVLFNQFHDILPGSAIAEVYSDRNRFWVSSYQTAERIVDAALRAIADQIQFPALPHPEAKAIVVFNPLSWGRSQVVELTLPQVQAEIQRQGKNTERRVNLDTVSGWKICDVETGMELAVQSRFPWKLTFLAEQVPALGYRCFWLMPADGFWKNSEDQDEETEGDRYVLENQYLRVMIDPQTGGISSLFDRLQQRELLNGEGNQLQAFQDEGQYWDAWNINPKYADFPLPPATLLRIYPESKGAIATRIKVERQIGQSVFEQTYVLPSHAPVLSIETEVDWQEKHVLVKAAFPLNLEAEQATYEIPFGSIQRPTRPQTEHEKTKWEVPAVQWADLTDRTGSYGVSLLNDCKYGYDATSSQTSSQLRLTLLRGCEWPDPNTDNRMHRFTYALYPHVGTWKASQTVRQGYELNQPMRVVWMDTAIDSSAIDENDVECLRSRHSTSFSQQYSSAIDSSLEGSSTGLPTTGMFLELSAENLVVSAIKPAEGGEGVILRCYEVDGDEGAIAFEPSSLLSSLLPVEAVERVSLLEQGLDQQIWDKVEPYQVATFRLG
jgi:alpha-mannosidase